MSQTIPQDSIHYNELIARQIEQYKETEIMHDLPAIYDYVSKKYIEERSTFVTGSPGLIEFYGDYFIKSLHESDSNFLISVGSGDCSLEIQIVKYLIEHSESNFFFVCLELSPILIDKARRKIDVEGLGDVITVAQTDINKWNPRFTFAGVMAHHALHHFLSLEILFELIKKNLAPRGRFLTCDIIGRNGHMRWPEALILTRKIWERIPRKYKFHHAFKQFDDYLNNWDCSVEGFEGIRAQDILPLLNKTFSFEVFFCHGNLTDLFIDRGFGPNYDPSDPADTVFIDSIQILNDRLISEGILKPTSMTAVMVNEKVSSPKMYKHWSSEFAVRNPNDNPPVFNADSLLESISFPGNPEKNFMILNKVDKYNLSEKLNFGNQRNDNSTTEISGLQYLKYGWAAAESSFCWTNCEDAEIVLPLEIMPDTDLEFTMEFIPYISSLYPETIVTIFVNDVLIKDLHFAKDSKIEVITETVFVPLAISRSVNFNVRFILSGRRLPQYESGGEVRSLGIALISAILSKKKR